jgi:hypothetical protein
MFAADEAAPLMSAMGQKADIAERGIHFRF